ncbi:hypothetical protein IPJ70_00290 [Candidatus Campbellbacteria bacterium]|nr:MAG: hypothetical protein IPJ70_00290 [Candidatus Campbellbacteria bacterium]
MKNLLEKFKQLSLFKQIIIVLVVLTIVIVNFDLFKNLVYIGLIVGVIYLLFTKVFRSPKRKGLDLYSQKIKELLIDGNLSDEEKIILEEIKKEHNLTDKDVEKYNLAGFKIFFDKITDDSRITEAERKELVKIYSDLNLSTDNLAYNQSDFNKYHTLYLIDEGKLPTIDVPNLNVNLSNGEKLHYVSKAFIIKNKSITKSYNYSGFSASIKIAKGLRYRVGNVKINPQKVNVMMTDDAGTFYLTTENLGYIGLNKHFSIPYDKISSLDIRDGFLYLYKKGKEGPFIISMDDFELPLAIVSFKINE